MDSNAQPMLIIAGPTAVGKTQVAIEWAHHLNAEIINADATLVYRGMDIGTAKPTLEERKEIVHHLIDIVDVRDVFSVKDFVEHAQAAVADIMHRGKRVIVVGGSGFYLKSFFAPVVDDLPALPDVTLAVDALYLISGLQGCLDRLHVLNPEGVGNLDVHNPRRVLRALERCLSSGKTITELKTEFDAKPCPFADIPKKAYLLKRSREELEERISLRTSRMLEAGLIGEVHALLEQGLRENPSACRAIGYREVIEYLDQGETLEALKATIIQNTLQLIKKQLTFFKHQLTIDQEINGDSIGTAYIEFSNYFRRD